VQQRWVLRWFFKPVEIVGVFAKVDEATRRVVGIAPGDNKNRIIGAAFNGPLTEHLFILAAERLARSIGLDLLFEMR
jgi:hypothetical protein